MSVHSEVTGSCNLAVIKFPDGSTTKFIVDCGLFQEREYEEYNSSLPFDAENIDFCLVTHNHVDHIGRLPLLIKNGFYGTIYATDTTCKLLPLALGDTHKILAEIAKSKAKKCLYSEADVANTLNLLKSCEFDKTIQVTENVKVTFLRNGHLIGAALILVQINYSGCEDINLLFTGDYNNKNMFFDVPPVPDWVLELPLTIIQESTYGNMNSSEMTKVFRNNILKHVEEGGTIIVPVFSLGRSQEILYEIKTMQDEGMIEDIPVYLDGNLAIRYTNLYIKEELGLKEEMKEFLPKNLTIVDKANRSEALTDKKQKIILTTSGMASYGPAQCYIIEYVSNPKTLIHFTGYTAEGTLDRRLKDTEKGKTVLVGGVVVKKRAEVEYTTEFSAHAKADEMIDFLNQFKNLRLVLVNHGNYDMKEIFAQRILDETEAKKVGILGRDYLFRVNPYGLVKTMSTKFK
ncbi:MAG: MBL fold metallo-hydrolase [Clostridia bacterium]|nr:MBL fold metallo-hydrolase [Clostridia bacterium]